MDLQQLRNVVEVAACGSISKAAKKLYMGPVSYTHLTLPTN